jgi:predicted ABC-type ATPase
MHKDTPILIAIGGPIGSGKSFVYKLLVKDIPGWVYVNTDEIARELNPEGFINEAQYRIASKEADRRRDEALAQGKNLIIFESPFSNPEKIEYIQRARNVGYFSRLYFVGTNDVAINMGRNELRKIKEHRGPTDDMVRDSYEDALAGYAVAALIAQETIVFDNSVNFADAKPIFKTQNGIVTCLYNSPTPWTKKLIDQFGTVLNYDKPTPEQLKENLFLINHEIARLEITPTPVAASLALGRLNTEFRALLAFREELRNPNSLGGLKR